MNFAAVNGFRRRQRTERAAPPAVRAAATLLELEMSRTWTMGLAMLVGLRFGTAVAQDMLSDGDREFIEQAVQGGQAEVAIGKSAAESKNPAISAFGMKMVTEHGKMNDELAMLAKNKGVEPPTSAGLGSQAKNLAVSVLPGSTFDSQYISSQISDHQKALTLFHNEAQSGQDPDLKAFATKGVPAIEQHIVDLEKLKQLPELQ